jgi:hypothetical protein
MTAICDVTMPPPALCRTASIGAVYPSRLQDRSMPRSGHRRNWDAAMFPVSDVMIRAVCHTKNSAHQGVGPLYRSNKPLIGKELQLPP